MAQCIIAFVAAVFAANRSAIAVRHGDFQRWSAHLRQPEVAANWLPWSPIRFCRLRSSGSGSRPDPAGRWLTAVASLAWNVCSGIRLIQAASD